MTAPIAERVAIFQERDDVKYMKYIEIVVLSPLLLGLILGLNPTYDYGCLWWGIFNA